VPGEPRPSLFIIQGSNFDVKPPFCFTLARYYRPGSCREQDLLQRPRAARCRERRRGPGEGRNAARHSAARSGEEEAFCVGFCPVSKFSTLRVNESASVLLRFIKKAELISKKHFFPENFPLLKRCEPREMIRNQPFPPLLVRLLGRGGGLCCSPSLGESVA